METLFYTSIAVTATYTTLSMLDSGIRSGNISPRTGEIATGILGRVVGGVITNSWEYRTGSPLYGFYGDEMDFSFMSKQGSVDPSLPANPDDLLKRPGWKETTHPEVGKRGHRTFENKETGEKLRHDKGKSWETGHKAHDHYHRPNPNATGKRDKYLDGQGNQVRDESDSSHIYPPGCVWWN